MTNEKDDVNDLDDSELAIKAFMGGCQSACHIKEAISVINGIQKSSYNIYTFEDITVQDIENTKECLLKILNYCVNKTATIGYMISRPEDK